MKKKNYKIHIEENISKSLTLTCELINVVLSSLSGNIVQIIFTSLE